ncbi:hypothetical protein ADG881_2381 [Alcanivorax sp. DG881]|nr:hypothetical protein ADG881_2381 [Alcanivorax sp. DG881]
MSLPKLNCARTKNNSDFQPGFRLLSDGSNRFWILLKF